VKEPVTGENEIPAGTTLFVPVALWKQLNCASVAIVSFVRVNDVN
jgi:hypothetical protein